MDNDNRELLTAVIAKNLNNALNAKEGSEESKAALRNAMDAIDRDIRIAKDDDLYREVESKLKSEEERIRIEREKLECEKQKLEHEKELRAQEEKAKRNEKIVTWVFRGLEIATPLVLTLIMQRREQAFKQNFARECMNWEKTGETFTSIPGRSIRDFFRHKN